MTRTSPITLALTLALPLVLSACAMSRFDDAGLSAPPAQPPGAANPVAPVQSEPLLPGGGAATAAAPATKNNVVAFEYSSAFTYVDLAGRIDRAVQSCWIGKNKEFAGYSYGGMQQEKSRFVLSLNETDANGQQAAIVKVTVVPASGQDGYAVTLQTRAEGSPGEKTMISGIRRIVTGQKVC